MCLRQALILMFLFLPRLALGQNVTKEQIERNARGRYESPEQLEQRPAGQVFVQPAFKGDRSILNGLGRKTAGELGLAGMEVWNEYPVRCDQAAEADSRAVKVVLDPRAEVFYDTASFQAIYIDGCICGGKPWVNRIALVKRDLEIEKTATGTGTDGRFRYSITFRLTGNAVQHDVELRDQLPQSLRYVPSAPSLSMRFGTMEPGESKIVEYLVEVVDQALPPGIYSFTNLAFVKSREVNEKRAEATVSMTITPPPPRPLVVEELLVPPPLPPAPKPESPPPPQVPPPPRIIISPCPEVPTDAVAPGFWGRIASPLVPRNLWETGMSVGGGAGGAYAFSSKSVRGKQVWQSALASLVLKFGVDWFNPDKDRLRVSVAGRDLGTYKRGDDRLLPGQMGRIVWQGNQARVFLMLEGGEALCGTGNTVNNVNLTPTPIIKIIREIHLPVEIPPDIPVKQPGVLGQRP